VGLLGFEARLGGFRGGMGMYLQLIGEEVALIGEFAVEAEESLLFGAE